MKTTAGLIRRSVVGVVAASAAGGALAAALVLPSLSSAPSATAAKDPCAASEVARTIGDVATSTGDYLDAHPQTNQALTTISKQQAGPQSLGALKAYFDANPEVAEDLQQLQQPLASLSGRCKLPLTLPQVMGLMQAAQQQGAGLPADLPAQAPTASTPALTAPGATAQQHGASPVSQGNSHSPSSAIAGLP
ncbi:hemophore [Mycolicibacterium novocastrense]|uniref:Fis family transcriptional regulator n=1 Tax=Mycolicibacterium novocastrense TaxID=59813 RepID=A0AAW5SG15_MYCNV|nr:hemophore [Mycolicibacterium novocastrense]MCV7022961.1 hemophore [Mycolicibacterium novocastrense]GAT10951.1 Fis family transcriptional regulator [Mycolicibacterium novocastrense]